MLKQRNFQGIHFEKCKSLCVCERKIEISFTLQRWAADINLRDGILKDTIKVMDITGSKKTSCDWVMILSFDEMKVSSLYEYITKDEVIGPHNFLQVIMARGLFSNWKQPIYIEFDKKTTRSLLDEAIIVLHNINYDVLACVLDCGSGNMGLWKELNINTSKTYSLSPVTRR